MGGQRGLIREKTVSVFSANGERFPTNGERFFRKR